jgi:hypothetical protein
MTMTEIPTSPHILYAAVFTYTLDISEKFCHQSPKIAATGIQAIISH